MEAIDAMQSVMEAMDRKIIAMQAEIDRRSLVRKVRRQLDESIRTMSELTARFDRGHERSGQVIDLPPLPRRTGREVN
jgi:hypothetical protein